MLSRILCLLFCLLLVSCTDEKSTTSTERWKYHDDLPPGYKNVKELGQDWVTFEWEGRTFLYHRYFDNFQMMELSPR